MTLPGFTFFTLLALGAFPASGGIYYACDASISSAACSYLNNTVAGYYNSTFSNANATIYVTLGTADLGESTTGYLNPVTYSSYHTALVNNATKDAIDLSALTALNSYDSSAYGSGNVELTSALAGALGISSGVDGSIVGVEYSSASNAGGGDGAGISCTNPGNGSQTSTCYNGIITISNAANLYYDVGSETSGQYDFYAVVQHETDEVLGTASCIGTTAPTLQDGCGGTTPSAIDLYRYNSAGNLVLNSAYVNMPYAESAYFSYDGGTTNGADGFVFNSSSNGNDYADFVFNGCSSGPISIQDAVNCGGGGTPQDMGLTILNDGGAEINMLNAVGFDVNPAPEPATVGLLGASLAALALLRIRRARK